MKIFTIAVGDRYEAFAEKLLWSGKRFGYTIDVLRGDVPKYLKIEGLRCADDCLFIDADCLILRPLTFDRIGAYKSEWPEYTRRYFPDNPEAVKKYLSAVDGIPGLVRDEDWNSGVLYFPKAFAAKMAGLWEIWWNFCRSHRDQASFRVAYALLKNNYPNQPWDLEPTMNWIIKRKGINPDAHILHAAGHPNEELMKAFESFTHS